MSNVKNFSYSNVATAPSPASSGTSLVVTAADGAKFPPVPFNATIWPAGVRPTSSNAEVVTVTAISTDTFTITRAQEGSSARTVIITDQIAATITANSSVQATRLLPISATTQDIVLDASADFLGIDTLEVGGSYSLELPSTSTAEVKVYAPSGDKQLTPRMMLNGILRWRQGGTSDDASWITTGTTNTDTSTKNVFMQAGSNVSNSSSGTDVTVTFPVAFTQVPLVFVTVGSAGTSNQYATVNTVTTTTFKFRQLTGTSAETVHWWAIGQ